MLFLRVAKRSVEGTCHLCGMVGKLSYEHVPPEKAFNDRRVLAHTLDDLIKNTPGKAKGKIYQRGAGAYTLCPRCNNNTGSWYGDKYIEWVQQGMFILQTTQRAPSLWYNFHVFPLRIIKQIACMFCSINSSTFRTAQPELERFILDRERRHLPENLRIFAFYAVDAGARQSSVSSAMNIFDSSKNRTFTEMTFIPFGYAMTFEGQEPPHADMADISFFGRYDFNSWTTIPLKLPVLPTVSYLPGDYRTQAEIDKTIRETGDWMNDQPIRLYNSERQNRFEL